MATSTATLFANTPKAVHAGLNAIVVSYSHATAASAGDVVFLAKLPHGARVVELIEDHSTGATSNALSIGLAKGGAAGGGASLSAFIASGAQATKNRLSVMGIPAQVSVSDGDGERWGILAAKLTEAGTATTGLVINVACLYLTDGS